ncbi:30S ribosomal protein S17 [Candidatus Nomurabacteria bacterium]|nr:30S ribosomal protein S17 [Candidatus Nomurabacteria bacterium]
MSQKQLSGVVTSDSRDKTITVVVTSRETHPLYKKQYTVNRSYQVHDEKNEAHVGDRVTAEACRPFSKTKAFKLKSIDAKSKGRVELKDEEELVEKKAAPEAPKSSKKEQKEA